MPWDVKKNGDKWCVYKEGSDTPIKGGCHSSRSAASAHARALYANVKDRQAYSHQSMVFSLAGTSDKTKDELMEGVWIHAVPYDKVNHPIFGEVITDPVLATRMKDNFEKRVFGNDVAIGYEHFGRDKAKGLKAAGWIQEVEPREDGIWQKIKFTGEAADEILDGAWRYFSAEWEPVYYDSHGNEHRDVIVGGAITNDPYYDGTVPLNFSSLLDEAAEWEHSEPGTGPTPREDEDDDGKNAQGVRNPSKPTPEPVIPEELLEASMKPEELAALRERLGLPDDGDITAAVEGLIAEVTPIREATKEADKVLNFSRDYPAEYEEFQQLKQSEREAKSYAFSRKYGESRLTLKEGEGDEAKEVPTTKGFSALTLNKIGEAHIAMSAGAFREEHLASVLDSILTSGLPDYGEAGSAVEPVEIDTADAPMAFSRKIAEIAAADQLPADKALLIAAEKYPELYKSYREAVGARS